MTKPTTSITVISSIPDESEQPLIDWLADGGWCSTIEVKQQATEAQLRSLRERGFDIVMTMPAHPATRAMSNRNEHVMPDNAGEVVDLMTRVFDGDASKVKWQCFVEEDSAGVAFSQQVLAEKPKTYQAAWKLREQRIDELLEVASEFPDIQLFAVVGFATTAHALMCRKNFAQVTLERTNDDIDDLQTGIAFMRGAARQYDKRWGIDFSLWWGPIFGTVGDLPASYHRRSLYLSYFSGAQELVMEGIGASCENMPDYIPHVATALEEVGKFIQREPAGKVDAPVAVMLPEDHGWMTAPYWDSSHLRWNYAHLRARPGDRGIDGFFGQAFPGNVYTMDPFPFGKYISDDPKATPFALSCITPEFAPSSDDVFDAHPPLPFGQFHDRNQARQWMHENKMETSDYRPMGDSRWGDIFDVLTVPAELEVLQKYSMVVLLGAVVLDDTIKHKLTKYVEAGGTLICAAGAVGPDDSNITGLRMEPRHRVGRAWCKTGANEQWVHEPLHYVPAQVIDEKTTSIDIQEASGDPLVAGHVLGAGKVYTCLTSWFEGANSDLSGPAASLFDKTITPLQAWEVKGLPIEWLSTSNKDTRTIVLANHSEQDWSGRVRCMDLPFKPKRIVELITGRNIDITGNSEWINLQIAKRDIAAYRIYK